MKKQQETRYIYKCRMCNSHFGNTYSAPGKEFQNLINAIYHISVDNQLPVPLTHVHQCHKKQFGIGDLIGCQTK